MFKDKKTLFGTNKPPKELMEQEELRVKDAFRNVFEDIISEWKGTNKTELVNL